MKQMGKNSKNHELLHFRQNGTPYNAMEEELTKCTYMQLDGKRAALYHILQNCLSITCTQYARTMM